MYIIIAGGGVVGRNLASRLIRKHDVVVIDKDREVCQQIYSQYGAVTINGLATSISILREAGINKCDAAVAAMPRDADNLSFALLAKSFNVHQILVRMREPDYRSAYRLAGATTIGGITEMIVESFTLDIEQPEIRKVYSLGNGEAEISIITIPEDAFLAGKTVSQIADGREFPDNCVIAGIYDTENDSLIVPRGQKKIHGGNQVFLVGHSDDIEQAAQYLRKT